MTDRELLEQAAKAAGIEGEYLPLGIRTYEPPHWSEDLGEFWNPLTDDGDALRLAVRLKFEVSVDVVSTSISGICDSDKDFVLELHGDDPYAATRRAIVRAAAEIGKEQK